MKRRLLVAREGNPAAEYHIRGAEGNYRWFKARALPLRSVEGEMFKWFGTNTDIEDMKRVETLLRESEDRLRAERDFTNEIVSGLPGVFYLFDRQGKFLRWNKNLEEIAFGEQRNSQRT